MSRERSASENDVAPRGVGRSTESTDEWTASHFVGILKTSGLVSADAVVQSRESPDGLLVTPKGAIGIEYTEAVPEAWAKADAFRNQNAQDSHLDRSHFQAGGLGETRTPSELVRDPDTPDRSPGWSGDSLERQLSSLVSVAIERKTAKLNKNFERFDEDWLVVYASSPGPMPDLERTRELVGLPPSRSCKQEFDRVFLLLDDCLLCLRSGTRYPASAV